MKPLKPPPSPDKLPLVLHFSIVDDPGEKGTHSVVVTEMRGDEVLRRKVIDTAPHVDYAVETINKAVYRIAYFKEGYEDLGDNP